MSWLDAMLDTPNGDDPPPVPWTPRERVREVVEAATGAFGVVGVMPDGTTFQLAHVVRTMIAMRRKGATFVEIGAALSWSPARVRTWWLRRVWYPALRPRAHRSVIGYELSQQRVTTPHA